MLILEARAMVASKGVKSGHFKLVGKEKLAFVFKRGFRSTFKNLCVFNIL